MLQGAKVSPLRHVPNGRQNPTLRAAEVRNGLPVERAYLWRGSPKLAEINAAIMAARAAQAPPPPRFTDCGTRAAYKRHRKLREAPCAACRKAAAEDRARYARRTG